jgi:type I restriction enzyme S subunit
MNKWKPISDFIVFSIKGITPKYVENSSIVVLNQKCIRNGIIDYSFSQFTDDTKEISETKFVQKGDILINSTGTGTAGRCAFVDELPEGKRLITDSHILLLRCNSYYEAQCLSYLLFSFEKTLMTFMTGSSGQGELDKVILLNLLTKLPTDKSTQQKIAKVLSNLDAKIEINNKINAELEAMAKMLYDYWFVQFDFPFDFAQDKPVTLSAVEVPYKSSGGKMVWNEELKREIPEGWEVKTLLDIATFTNGLACQKFRPNEDEDFYRVIKIREMGSGFTDNTEFVSRNIPERIVINNGYILFSWSATLDVKIWTGGKGALNQHIFKVTSEKYSRSYFYYELLNYLQHFKMQAELRKTTMGHITQDHLKQSRITIPPMHLIEKIDNIIKPILDKKVKLDEENQQLASLRDWLLPMLMNGQVRVGEVEEELGMVAESGETYKKI